MKLLFPQDCTRLIAQESRDSVIVQVNLATTFLDPVRDDRPASSACTGPDALGTVSKMPCDTSLHTFR